MKLSADMILHVVILIGTMVSPTRTCVGVQPPRALLLRNTSSLLALAQPLSFSLEAPPGESHLQLQELIDRLYRDNFFFGTMSPISHGKTHPTSRSAFRKGKASTSCWRAWRFWGARASSEREFDIRFAGGAYRISRGPPPLSTGEKTSNFKRGRELEEPPCRASCVSRLPSRLPPVSSAPCQPPAGRSDTTPPDPCLASWQR